jgi:type II secretory pathway pseudopilin PulG
MSLKRRLSSEAGFGIIEVLVTALVVLILAAGLLTGLDSSSRATGRAKARSVAMTLAQKDQERMRAMPIATLAAVDQTIATPICDANGANCVSYSVASKAQWVSDSLGLESCTTATAGLDYLKITSTVTWPAIGAAAPVTTQSMVAPAIGALGAGKGSLAVQVVRADGVTGVPGVSIGLSGAATDSGVTNSVGCVVWGLLPAGNFVAALNQAGFVGVQGVQAVNAPAGVVENSLSNTTILYDGAASATISFYSQIGSTTYPEKQSKVTLKQSQMSPVTRVFATPDGLPAASIVATSLFPFKTGSPGGPYSIYAGGCPGAESPSPVSLSDLTASSNANYSLRIPAFDFKVAVNGAVPATSAATTKTKIVPVTLNCDNPAAATIATAPVGSDSRPADPGFPYGTYDVCAEAQIGASTYHTTLLAQALNAPVVQVTGGATPGQIDVTTAAAPGVC